MLHAHFAQPIDGIDDEDYTWSESPRLDIRTGPEILHAEQRTLRDDIRALQGDVASLRAAAAAIEMKIAQMDTILSRWQGG